MSMTAAQIVAAMTEVKSAYNACLLALSANTDLAPVLALFENATRKENDLIEIGLNTFFDEAKVQVMLDNDRTISVVYYIQSLISSLQNYFYFVESLYDTDAGASYLATAYGELQDIINAL